MEFFMSVFFCVKKSHKQDTQKTILIISLKFWAAFSWKSSSQTGKITTIFLEILDFAIINFAKSKIPHHSSPIIFSVIFHHFLSHFRFPSFIWTANWIKNQEKTMYFAKTFMIIILYNSVSINHKPTLRKDFRCSEMPFFQSIKPEQRRRIFGQTNRRPGDHM